MIDEKAIEMHIRGILEALGDNPEREGLKDTPKRVARMYSEVFAGMNYTNHEIAQMFEKTFEDGEDMAMDGQSATWWAAGASSRSGSGRTSPTLSRRSPAARTWR